MPQNNPTIPGGLHVKPLPDGNLEFAVVSGDRSVAHGNMTPEQAGILAANFLHASHAAAFLGGKDLNAVDLNKKMQQIPVNRWALLHTDHQQDDCLVIQTGESSVCFKIARSEIRGLARHLIRSAIHPLSPVTLRDAFLDFLTDVRVSLSGFGGILSARVKASSLRRAASLKLLFSGRSFRVFKFISISPGDPTIKYAPIGKCIYCESKIYSQRPGDRQYPLGAEHILAEGLGGNLELPEASCQKCEGTTGRFVEGNVLGNTLKALRIFYGLKKKRSGSHPKTLPLRATIDGVERDIEMPISEYPIILNMLHYVEPAFFTDGREGYPIVRNVTFIQLQNNPLELIKKFNMTTFATQMWDNKMFGRMLAKIAHSLAVAELGESAFTPYLKNLIRKGTEGDFKYIGGEPVFITQKKSKNFHEVSLGYKRHDKHIYVVCKIRLFAFQNCPTYYVVVGESLESLIARLRRVFSNRISSMLFR